MQLIMAAADEMERKFTTNFLEGEDYPKEGDSSDLARARAELAALQNKFENTGFVSSPVTYVEQIAPKRPAPSVITNVPVPVMSTTQPQPTAQRGYLNPHEIVDLAFFQDRTASENEEVEIEAEEESSEEEEEDEEEADEEETPEEGSYSEHSEGEQSEEEEEEEEEQEEEEEEEQEEEEEEEQEEEEEDEEDQGSWKSRSGKDLRRKCVTRLGRRPRRRRGKRSRPGNDSWNSPAQQWDEVVEMVRELPSVSNRKWSLEQMKAITSAREGNVAATKGENLKAEEILGLLVKLGSFEKLTLLAPATQALVGAEEAHELEESLRMAERRLEEIEDEPDDQEQDKDFEERFKKDEYDGEYKRIGMVMSSNQLDEFYHERTKRTFRLGRGHLFVDAKEGLLPLRVVCGKERQLEVIVALHEGLAGGHRGADATYYKVSRLYHLDGLRDMVMRYCKSCEACQKR
ncbi:hypothetical protein CBR_g46345 [Chara braunii]|uniref:Integrase zinc-binding domain-containing protein n=1 Tax=Chara braunii TaxID=69332 RepID=A0A388M099_CHABU|nr:hypothetical protein CBR_g46345 [Chara braunii]|eukprot:GBG87976.1 hypothetical protein CBR_g46345 [Chara braunii]